MAYYLAAVHLGEVVANHAHIHRRCITRPCRGGSVSDITGVGFVRSSLARRERTSSTRGCVHRWKAIYVLHLACDAKEASSISAAHFERHYHHARLSSRTAARRTHRSSASRRSVVQLQIGRAHV